MLVNTSKIIKYIFIAFVLIVLIYAYFEARNLLIGPQISLSSNGIITVQDELIDISGTAKNVTKITLSGRPVFINNSGKFDEKLLLVKGINRFTFEARDKFNNKTSEVLEVVYKPKKIKENSQQNPKKTGTIEGQLKTN